MHTRRYFVLSQNSSARPSLAASRCVFRSYSLTVTNLKQEAGETTIDVYNDNPNHFDLMLRYLYEGEFYDLIAADFPKDYTSRILVSIGIEVLADKHDIPKLLLASTNKVEEDLNPEETGADFSTLESAIHECHGPSRNVGSEMGQAVARCFVADFWGYIWDAKFDELGSKYSALGADMIVATKFYSRIMPTLKTCTKPSCRRNFTLDAGWFKPRKIQDFFCEYCGTKQAVPQ